MENLLIVSADGHATMPTELWPEYLEKRYHELLPQLAVENEVFTRATGVMNDLQLALDSPDAHDGYEVFDREGRYRDGRWTGAWDADVRLGEMDREGVAAEFVFHGFFRACDLFFNVSNANYGPDVVEAGVRGYNRWLHDTFGDRDRLLLVAAVGRSIDRDVTRRGLEWAADHGFTASYLPGYTAHPDQAPLSDECWDPVWSLCEERGLPLVVHAGYGFEPGLTLGAVQAADRSVKAAGGTDRDLAAELTKGYFNDEGIFADLKSRRPIWQLALGGVFDRHPDLKVMFTEMRADWLPALLSRLDAVYEERRGDVPARRRPSEYWPSNCMVGLSFMHRSEIDMRDEIGVERISFGRDYPHTESTWPNTLEYLRALFVGVPEREVRLILGENLASFLGLDRAALAAVVERIGFSPADIVRSELDVDPDLVADLNRRCGFSKPPEGEARLPQTEAMLEEDLELVRR